MATKLQEQTAIDERVVDNNDLEAALEEREKKKAAKGAVTKQFKEADDKAKTMIAEFQLADGEIARCGRFRIAKKPVPGRSVAFDTDPTSRLTISAIDEA